MSTYMFSVTWHWSNTVCLIDLASRTITPAPLNSEESANDAVCMNILWELQQTPLAICPVSRKVLLCQIKYLVIKMLNVFCRDVLCIFYQADGTVFSISSSSVLLRCIFKVFTAFIHTVVTWRPSGAKNALVKDPEKLRHTWLSYFLYTLSRWLSLMQDLLSVFIHSEL